MAVFSISTFVILTFNNVHIVFVSVQRVEGFKQSSKDANISENKVEIIHKGDTLYTIIIELFVAHGIIIFKV